MGVSSGKFVHAGYRDGAHRRHDPRKAARDWRIGTSCLFACLIAGFFAAGSAPSGANTLRVATYNIEMNRAGPGLLLRDLQKGGDSRSVAAIDVVVALNADILVLTGFDFDLNTVALGVFADQVAAKGSSYPYRFALRPNTGLSTGIDLDGDGLLGGPGDAQGWGRFSGEGGMAVLSKLPIRGDEVRDFSGFLWRDLPGALLFDGMTADSMAVQRLSTTGHWDVPVEMPGGGVLHLLAWHATPPVFDGVEDRNGRRNHDEAVFWGALLDEALPMDAPDGPFVILGDGNLDPVDGDGLRDGILGLLQRPGVHDPLPGQDTADFSAKNGPGKLRVDYVLPSADLTVLDAGVMWPKADDRLAQVLVTASRHRPVWVDIDVR